MPEEIGKYINKFTDLGFKVGKIKEDNIEPFWFDFYGCLDIEEAKEEFGENNIREV